MRLTRGFTAPRPAPRARGARGEADYPQHRAIRGPARARVRKFASAAVSVEVAPRLPRAGGKPDALPGLQAFPQDRSRAEVSHPQGVAYDPEDFA